MLLPKIKQKITLFLIVSLLIWLINPLWLYAEENSSEIENHPELTEDTEPAEEDSGDNGIVGFIKIMIYNLKSIIEEYKISFTGDSLEKGKGFVYLADKKIEEANTFLNQNRYNFVIRAVNLYQKYMNKANQLLEDTYEDNERGKDKEEVIKIVEEATSKHLEVLGEVYQEVPQEAKDAILKAMEVSQKGNQSALEALNKGLGTGNDEDEGKIEEDNKESDVDTENDIDIEVDDKEELEGLDKALEMIPEKVKEIKEKVEKFKNRKK